MPNEETEDDELWDREVKVFADAKITSLVDVRELIEVGKNWEKVFALILSPPVDIICEENVLKLQSHKLLKKLWCKHNSS